MTRLSATDISYRVGRTTVLDGIGLTMAPAGLTAIVGPNGAGKTTLLRLLGGDLIPATGGVTIDEVELANLPYRELARVRALLTQDGARDIPFVVATVVALGRTPHRHSPLNSAANDADVVARVMDEVGITHLRERIFASLSGGERALVSLARVLAQQSRLLLLDEPTSALDVAIEDRTMRLLHERAVDTVVVCVLHDLNLAARYADRLILVSEGSVVADGPPGEVLAPDILTAVYGHPMRVVPHPFREGPLVLAE